MYVELGSTHCVDFATHSPTTGAATNADSTPTVEVFEGNNDTPVVSPTPAQRTARAGHYKVDVVATTANGFEVGKTYNVVVAATVGGITARAAVARFVVTTAVPLAVVVADGANTALTFKTDRTEATDNYWKDALVVFVTGSLVGQVKKCTVYTGATKFVTVEGGFTAAPAASDIAVLVNR